MLTTFLPVFKRTRKRASPIVAECRFGKIETLRTACEGNSSVESGTAVGPVPARPDTETGSSVLTKEGLKKPERG